MHHTCPVCSRQAAPATPARSARPERPRSAGGGRSARAATGVTVRRVERAADDGYDHDLVAGLRASADARRLAGELAFAAARLEELVSDPPRLYAEVAAAEDQEEAAWLAFLIAYVGPGRGTDAWSEIEDARVPWATGELPVLDGVTGGPRGAHDPAKGPAVVAAYRAWAQRSGGQVAGLSGDPGWDPARRFERVHERLAVPGFGRGPRYELLVTLGALGIVRVEPRTLAVGRDAMDPVGRTAKRVLGIGDALTLERRALELADGVGVPVAALDLAFFNLDRTDDERATQGARVSADPRRREAIAAALGLR